jgi:elongator complex protein 4
MSSFKRKPKATTGDSSSIKLAAESPAAQIVYPGTRISPASTLSLVTSTGISSLDDILGGGLPLSCSLVITAPDVHSSYGELVQKYFAAQGLAAGQRVCVVGQDAATWVRDLMWMPDARGVAVHAGTARGQGDSDEENEKGRGGKVTIAWRYEKMRQFQTTTSQ